MHQDAAHLSPVKAAVDHAAGFKDKVAECDERFLPQEYAFSFPAFLFAQHLHVTG